MVVELKHGELNVKLQICNDAWISAVTKFEDETEISVDSVFGGSGFGIVALFMYYGYFSYKVYCSRNNVKREYDIHQFKDLWNKRDVDVNDSNIGEVINAMSKSILPEEAKKKYEELEAEGK